MSKSVDMWFPPAETEPPEAPPPPPEIDETPPDAPAEESDDGDDDEDDFWYMHCVNCGIEFGMPLHLHEQRRLDGRKFWCPNGHDMWYQDTPERRVEKAQKEALQAKSRAEQLEAKLGEAAREANKPENRKKWWWT